MSGKYKCGGGMSVLAVLVALSMAACTDNGANEDVISYDFIHGFDINYGDSGSGSDTIVGTDCRSDDDCDPDTPHCLIAHGVCVECITQADCQGQGFCLDGYVCGLTTCQPGEATCVKNVAKVCNVDGSKLDEIDCSIEDKYCVDGACYTCPPNLGDCPSDKVARRCREDGTGWDQQTCGSGLTCANGDCLACIPGEYICDGSTKVKRCAMDGSGFVDDKDCWDLNDGDICHMGQCINLCEFTSKFYTNKGCEYYAIDMEQYVDSEDFIYNGEDAPFAVVVSNTYDALDATVKVYQGDSLVKTVTAKAGLATIINLDPLNLRGAGITDQTFHIKSNLPIVAYQFNPLENVEVYSNDASLLLPTNVLGRNYRVMSMPSSGYNADMQFLSSNVAIVAVEEGDTTVTMVPTANVIAGSNTLGVKKGYTEEWVLKQGQVFNVLTENTTNLDLTGSLITADKKVAVFSGHICENVPSDVCCCDHLEEQLQPIEAWGKEYIIPKTKARGTAPDTVRVIAHQDNTRITIVPPVSGSKVLSAGELYEFEIDRSVLVSSDKQFLAALILESQDSPDGDLGLNNADIGDPSLVMAVPVEQYRDYYIFLVPTKYADSYISVVAPTGTSVKLDGTAIASSEFTAVSTSGFMTAIKHVNPGSHTLESDKSVGLYVYGWDQYVSYGYPGGMMLLKIAGDVTQ